MCAVGITEANKTRNVLPVGLYKKRLAFVALECIASGPIQNHIPRFDKHVTSRITVDR